MRRDDLLRGAAEVFMDKGYGATSLSQIAEHLGCTKGKLYYYYSSKFELYLDIHVTALRLVTERCRAARASEGSPDRQLWAIVRQQAHILLEGSPLVRVAIQGLERYMMASDGSPLDRLARQLVGLRAEFEGICIEVIERGTREGAFPADTDARLSVKWVLGVVNWMVVWVSPGKPASRSAETVARSAADFALAGMVRNGAVNPLRS